MTANVDTAPKNASRCRHSLNHTNITQSHLNQTLSKSVPFLQKINPFSPNHSASSGSVSGPNEFRSVSTLKQFWIDAFSSSNKFSDKVPPDKKKRATICVSSDVPMLLVNNNSGNSSTAFKDRLFRRGSFKKSKSTDTSKEQIDNFYKYKTADLMREKRSKSAFSKSVDDAQLTATPLQVSSNKTGAITAVGAGSDGEKNIHWPKRDDFILTKSENNSLIRDNETHNNLTQNPTISSCSINNDSTIIFANNRKSTSSKLTKAVHLLSQNTTTDKITTAAATTTTMAVESTLANAKSSSHSAGSSAKSATVKRNSSSASSTLSNSSNTLVAVRKFSFRTNSYLHHGHHYYNHKKMAGGGNKVAALTHRFNQLIQQDASLLEEVKKNKEIVVKRTSGHVYKIMEDPASARKRTTSDKEDCALATLTPQRNVKKRPSVKRRKSAKIVETSQSSVKAAILFFEEPRESIRSTFVANCEISAPVILDCKQERPKVPKKSDRVMMRTKEIVLKNNQKRKEFSENHNNSGDSASILEKIKEEDFSEVDRRREEDKILNNIKNVCNDKTVKNIEGAELIYKRIENNACDNVCLPMNDKNEVKQQVQSGVGHELLVVDKSLTLPAAVIIKPIELDTKRSRVGRIYDKFRFKPLFAVKAKQENNEETVPKTERPDQRIIDALADVNKKIAKISQASETAITFNTTINDGTPCITIPQLLEPNESNCSIQPNDSFLFRGKMKTIFCSTYDINHEQRSPVEAINTVTIAKTQSMDESRFAVMKQQLVSLDRDDINCSDIFKKTDELLIKLMPKLETNENDYEVIRPIDDSGFVDDTTFKNGEKVATTTFDRDNGDNRIYSDINKTNHSHCIYEKSKPIENHQDNVSINSYESCENYEAIPDDDCIPHHHQKRTETEDGYEICDPPEPPPPRKKSEINLGAITLSDCSGEPTLPVPKRNAVTISNNCDKNKPKYEHIKYKKIPPRPPKAPAVVSDNEFNDSDSIGCGENIYDTVKHTDAVYDPFKANHPNDYYKMNDGLKHSDSISTLSSDHKTNSLYGAGSICTRKGNQFPASENSSENSDDWVDISDDPDENHHQERLIVIRKRNKGCPRSPDWSRKVRDQRRNRHNQRTVNDDDSDHYYESLCPMDEHQHQANQPKLRTITNVSLHSQFEDDYDSFDTDNDEGTDYEHADAVDEDNEDAKKNDSGVDVSHPTAKRLPEPPVTPTSSHPTNQVYALVQKLKNLGSLPKSLKLGKKKSSPSMTSKTSLNEGTPETKQVYENAQFYVDREYQNTTFTGKKLKTLKKLPLKENQDPYENTEFHSPRTPVIVSPTTPTAIEQSELDPSGINGKKKDKYTKSFKSKFKRKSLGNESSMLSGSGETRSTFYVCDSAEMDSGIFTSQVLNTEQPTAITKMPELASGTLTRRSWRFMSSPELNRRKSTLRPNDPPPPPPTSGSGKQKRSESTTSWYTEVGVFNSKHEIKEPDKSDDGKSKIKGQTSWYTEAGVYQTISGASLASSTTSSNSSGVSTGDDHSHSMFLNEPLYQIYSAAKLESISQDIERAEASNCKFASKTSLNDDESDGYEEIGALSEEQDGLKKRNLRPSALQLVGPKYGPSRTLWSEIPEVRSSEILSTLTPTEKRLQEAKFEILTSEASYLKSLSLLKSHFINHPAFRDVNIITTSDRRALFAYVTPVLECSDRLLCDLEKCWQDNIMLIGLSRSVYKHAEAHFHVYVAYCEHQGKMDRTLKRLKGDQRNTSFFQSMEMLETDPKCCGLSLHSFLMLPMQRITRLPLLVDAVLSKLHSDDDEFDSWKMTLAILNKIVAQCNEAANKSEQTYEMEIISKQIEFPPYMRPLAIQPVGVGAYTKRRALVRRGELTHLVWRGDDGKLTFGKKFTKQSIYIFLFTDLLVLAKKKAENCYLVQDYCPRSMLNVSSGDVIPQLPTKDVAAVAGKHLILMTLLENYDEKTVELILACPSETERQRWLQATEPLASENPDDKIYEQWDCPQVMAKHVYQAQEPDELALDPGDIVNVTKKMADGWYQGERIRDGAQGWFPGNYVEEVASPHVRARNLKQRYRLLTFTSAYLESQKKK